MSSWDLNPDEGMVCVEDCFDCVPGQYCGQTGFTAPDGPCDAEYYCIGKAIISFLVSVTSGSFWPAGGYCPTGSESRRLA